jgi:hypothetical protein
LFLGSAAASLKLSTLGLLQKVWICSLGFDVKVRKDMSFRAMTLEAIEFASLDSILNI